MADGFCTRGAGKNNRALPTEQKTMMNSQTIPQNREAEEAVIGAVLIRPEVYFELAQFLQAEDFYIHRHRWIWEAVTRLHEQRIPLDILTVTEELDRAGQLSEIGGPAYLTALLNQVPTSLHAEAYGHMVEAEAIRRRMLNAANQIATLAYDHQKEADELLADGLALLQNAHRVRASGDESAAQLASRHYDQTEKRASELRSGKTSNILLGYPDLDCLLRLRSAYMLLAGRPGKGKTSFALNVALNVARGGRSVGIFSGEMSKDELTNSLISILSELDGQNLEEGSLKGNDEWAAYTQAVESLSLLQIDIHDFAPMSMPLIRARCLAGQYDFVIIDYLLLLRGHTEERNLAERVGLLNLDLKTLQRELNVPLLCLHHMNRGVEQRAEDDGPRLSDLYQSGERDPDIIAFIHSGRNPIADREGRIPVTITIEKHRRGPKGQATLLFKPPCTKFFEPPIRNYYANGGSNG